MIDFSSRSGSERTDLIRSVTFVVCRESVMERKQGKMKHLYLHRKRAACKILGGNLACLRLIFREYEKNPRSCWGSSVSHQLPTVEPRS